MACGVWTAMTMLQASQPIPVWLPLLVLHWPETRSISLGRAVKASLVMCRVVGYIESVPSSRSHLVPFSTYVPQIATGVMIEERPGESLSEMWPEGP